ncbi:hypothetical protein ACRAWG_32285 [Methylobacterium sp. P31]
MSRLRWLMIGLCMAADAISDIDHGKLAVAAPLMVAGGLFLLGAFIDLFVVGEITPLPVRDARAPTLQPEAVR